MKKVAQFDCKLTKNRHRVPTKKSRISNNQRKEIKKEKEENIEKKRKEKKLAPMPYEMTLYIKQFLIHQNICLTSCQSVILDGCSSCAPH